jgi:hypothetical protein
MTPVLLMLRPAGELEIGTKVIGATAVLSKVMGLLTKAAEAAVVVDSVAGDCWTNGPAADATEGATTNEAAASDMAPSAPTARCTVCRTIMCET